MDGRDIEAMQWLPQEIYIKEDICGMITSR